MGCESVLWPSFKGTGRSRTHRHGHGWDLHAMGNVRQGSGGSEWVAVYNDEFLVRFTAMQASITYSDDGEPSIRALVHPMYCDEVQEECRIDMKLP